MKSKNQNGFTLIELMISVVILGVIFTGVAGMFQSQLAASLSNQDEAEMQGSVQSAANMISNDIIMAGYGALPGAAAFAGVDVAGATPGADSLTIASASDSGTSIGTFIVSGGNLFNGSILPLRCFGRDGDGVQTVAPFLGEPADFYRDAMHSPLIATRLLFVNPFTGVPLTSISPNPIDVLPNPAQLTADGRCRDSGLDTNGDSVNEAIVNVQVAATITVPQGTAVYGLRGGGTVNYQVDVSTSTLTKNGVPILVGVDDLQFRFFDAAACAAGCDTVAGMNQQTITHINIGMVVRNQRRDPLNIGDDYTERITFNHELAITPDMAQFARRQYLFTVRPKNNGP